MHAVPPYRPLHRIVLLVLATACALAATTAVASAATPGFSQVVTTKYYAVSGTTLEQIRAGVKANGPLGGEFSGATKTTYDWRYRYRSTRAGCAAKQVRGIEYVRYDFPRWLDYATANAGAKRHWDTYMAGLRLHESGHADISAVRVKQVITAVAHLPAKPTCAAFQASAKRRVSAIWSTVKAADTSYDAVTNHGFTQGAWLLSFVDAPAAPAVTSVRNADGSWTDTVTAAPSPDAEQTFVLRGCIEDDHVSPRFDFAAGATTVVDTIAAGTYPAGTALCYRFWSSIGDEAHRSWSQPVDVHVTLA